MLRSVESDNSDHLEGNVGRRYDLRRPFVLFKFLHQEPSDLNIMKQ